MGSGSTGSRVIQGASRPRPAPTGIISAPTTMVGWRRMKSLRLWRAGAALMAGYW